MNKKMLEELELTKKHNKRLILNCIEGSFKDEYKKKSGDWNISEIMRDTNLGRNVIFKFLKGYKGIEFEDLDGTHNIDEELIHNYKKRTSLKDLIICLKDQRIEVLKKEIDNYKKQIDNYKKQIDNYKNQIILSEEQIDNLNIGIKYGDVGDIKPKSNDRLKKASLYFHMSDKRVINSRSILMDYINGIDVHGSLEVETKEGKNFSIVIFDDRIIFHEYSKGSIYTMNIDTILKKINNP